MIRRPPRSTPLYSSAASDVYKRQRPRRSRRSPRSQTRPGHHRGRTPRSGPCSCRGSTRRRGSAPSSLGSGQPPSGHSAAVHYRGKTVLILGGESNHGKSMGLIEACVRGGVQVASETSVIDESGVVVKGSREPLTTTPLSSITEVSDATWTPPRTHASIRPMLLPWFDSPPRISTVFP